MGYELKSSKIYDFLRFSSQLAGNGNVEAWRSAKLKTYEKSAPLTSTVIESLSTLNWSAVDSAKIT